MPRVYTISINVGSFDLSIETLGFDFITLPNIQSPTPSLFLARTRTRLPIATVSIHIAILSMLSIIDDSTRSWISISLFLSLSPSIGMQGLELWVSASSYGYC